jgi:hypothetical protein
MRQWKSLVIPLVVLGFLLLDGAAAWAAGGIEMPYNTNIRNWRLSLINTGREAGILGLAAGAFLIAGSRMAYGGIFLVAITVAAIIAINAEQVGGLVGLTGGVLC